MKDVLNGALLESYREEHRLPLTIPDHILTYLMQHDVDINWNSSIVSTSVTNDKGQLVTRFIAMPSTLHKGFYRCFFDCFSHTDEIVTMKRATYVELNLLEGRAQRIFKKGTNTTLESEINLSILTDKSHHGSMIQALPPQTDQKYLYALMEYNGRVGIHTMNIKEATRLYPTPILTLGQRDVIGTPFRITDTDFNRTQAHAYGQAWINKELNALRFQRVGTPSTLNVQNTLTIQQVSADDQMISIDMPEGLVTFPREISWNDVWQAIEITPENVNALNQ